MPTSNDIRAFKRWLRYAQRNNWRLATEYAEALGAAALKVGAIDQERLPKLVRKLQYGEVYVRDDRRWACSTCGGNCGQCGDTSFYGNIGFSMQHLAEAVEGNKGLYGSLNDSKESGMFKTVVNVILLLIALWVMYVLYIGW